MTDDARFDADGLLIEKMNSVEKVSEQMREALLQLVELTKSGVSALLSGFSGQAASPASGGGSSPSFDPNRTTYHPPPATDPSSSLASSLSGVMDPLYEELRSIIEEVPASSPAPPPWPTIVTPGGGGGAAPPPIRDALPVTPPPLPEATQLQGTIAAAIQPLIAIVESIRSAMSGLMGGSGTAAKTPGVSAAEPAKSGGLSGAFSRGKETAEGLPGKVAGAIGGAVDKAGDIPGVGGALQGIAGVAGAATGALSTMMGAASAVTGTFNSVVSTAMGFVEQLNPAALIPLNQAFRDLSATIGTAMMPIIEGATKVLQEVGSLLEPIMQQLQPVVQSLVETLMQAAQPFLEVGAKFVMSMIPIVELLADMAKSFLPLIEGLAAIQGVIQSGLKVVIAALIPVIQTLLIPLQLFGQFLQAITPLLEIVSAVLSGFATALTAMVKGLFGGLEGTFDTLRDVMEDLGKSIVLVIAAMAKLAGYDNFLKGFLKGLEKPDKESNIGKAVVQGVQIQGFEAFEKTMLQAAAKAGPGGAGVETKKPSDWLAEIRGQLEVIKSGELTKQFKADLKEMIDDAAEAIVQGFLEALGVHSTPPQEVQVGAWSAKQTLKHPLDHITDPIKLALGAMSGR